MNIKETTKFLNKMAGLYQNFRPDSAVRDQWASVFADVSADAVSVALTKYIKGKDKEFAPAPNELFALLPRGAAIKDEHITWASDGESYTIERGGERHTYLTASPAEKWKERKSQHARGYGLCFEKRPRGWVTFYRPISRCVQTGTDSFGAETLPRYGAA